MSTFDEIRQLVHVGGLPACQQIIGKYEQLFTRNEVEFKNIPFLLKIFRQFKSTIRENEAAFVELLRNHCINEQSRLFAECCFYELCIDRKNVLANINQLMQHLSQNSLDDFLTIFNDEENVHFFGDPRPADVFHRFVKWRYKYLSYPDSLHCPQCESALFPFLEEAHRDRYKCYKENCTYFNKVVYKNHCWNCNADIDSAYNYQCKSCDWYICNSCNKCSKGNNCTPNKLSNDEVVVPQKYNLEYDIFWKGILDPIRQRLLNRKINVDIGRGKKVLNSEDELDIYLVMYLEMHLAKLDVAINDCKIMYPFPHRINIYDWGCGQGIATITFMQKNKIRLRNCHITVILIEPSLMALLRAEKYIRTFSESNGLKSEIRLLNYKLDSISKPDVVVSDGLSAHLFSNIIDVEEYSISNLCNLLESIITRKNTFICISPKYSGAAKRIDEFHDYFCAKKGYKFISFDHAPLSVEMLDYLRNKKVARTIKRYQRIFELDKIG